MTAALTAINWNRIQDDTDLAVWNRVTSNFWLPEKLPLSNDLASWATLTESEKLLTIRVFAGLTLLDTLQGTVGMPAMIKDAQTEHEKAVLTNFSFMEAFSGETELLTPTGWVRIDELPEGVEVAQFDPDTKVMSFVVPKHINPHFNDEVYEIQTSNGGARQVVSGGHRIYFEHNGAPSVTTARELHAKMQSVKNISTGRKFIATGSARSEPGSELTSLDRLKIAVQADGSFRAGSIPRYTGTVCGAIPAQITLRKERKIERLITLASESGVRLEEVNLSDTSKGRCFKVYLPLGEEGDRYAKNFNCWWNFKYFTKETARQFIEELGLWDGHTLKGGNGVTYYTTNKDNADFVAGIAALAGYRSRMSCDRRKRSSSHKDCFVLNICYHKDSTCMQRLKTSRVPGRTVYCVQVPTTYLLTRNGPYPVVSGNCVHAKSYSSIFSTLCSTGEIEGAFKWVEQNQQLQQKAALIDHEYGPLSTDLRKKVASVFLESFLFYSGFYLPFHWASRGKLTNTADVIRLIVRDEALHGYYIGYKFQRAYEESAPSYQQTIKSWAYQTLEELYELEVIYATRLYQGTGLTEDVCRFLRYNANKAMANLGFEPLFPVEETRVNPAILAALSPSANENHDFFSGSGSSYVIGKGEDTEDSDWAF